jgi:hypothetical protein
MTVKAYLYATAIIGLFGAGWYAANWHRDSIELAAKKEREEILKAVREKESGIAVEVEKKLAELKANERIIENHTREVIRDPIYRNICIDDAGLQIINSYARGDAAELISEMPD